MSSRTRTSLPILLALGLLDAAAGAAQPSLDELLRLVDDQYRGESSRGRVSMNVKTSRWERNLTMEVASKGTDKTLVRILSPAKERGTATLKVGTDIWNYLPKVDRTIKVPSSMMSGSWMGSHFTNDDLVQDSRYSENYDCELLASPGDGSEIWAIECIPHEDAVIVWGKVEIDITAALHAREARFFDEDGALQRTMQFLDVGPVGDRELPTRMRMVPADEPDEYTEMIYDDLEIDVELPDRLFTLQELRR